MAGSTLPFSDKVAVVTGAASGLGAASAQRLAADGATVVAVDVNGEALEQLVASLPGDGHLAVTGDISVEADVERYIRAALDAHGRIDLYHLNAGIFGEFAPLPKVSTEGFARVMEVNVHGTFLGLRAAFRQYHEQQTRGAIVVTASIASLRGSADLIAYQTSKHAVLGLMRGAAMYGAPIGVRVNAVAPGIVPTGLFSAAADTVGGGDDMAKRASTVPLRRAGTAAEIAGVVAFLLSDDAAYVIGEAISIDGGATVVNTVRPSGGAGAWDPSEIDRLQHNV